MRTLGVQDGHSEIMVLEHSDDEEAQVGPMPLGTSELKIRGDAEDEVERIGAVDDMSLVDPALADFGMFSDRGQYSYALFQMFS